jgi:hypothetical protein
MVSLRRVNTPIRRNTSAITPCRAASGQMCLTVEIAVITNQSAAMKNQTEERRIGSRIALCMDVIPN